MTPQAIIAAAVRELSAQHGRAVSAAEIAQHVGMTAAWVRKYWAKPMDGVEPAEVVITVRTHANRDSATSQRSIAGLIAVGILHTSPDVNQAGD